MTVELLEGERLDDLQNGYRLIQDPKDFCYGIDAVLLAWFARVKPGENVLDLGTGSGVVPLLMKARTEGKHFTGLEIQEKSAAMARRSVAWNHLEQDVSIVTGDIKEAAGLFGAASFDVVTSNPPYMTGSHGLINPHQPKDVYKRQMLESMGAVATPIAWAELYTSLQTGVVDGQENPPANVLNGCLLYTSRCV